LSKSIINIIEHLGFPPHKNELKGVCQAQQDSQDREVMKRFTETQLVINPTAGVKDDIGRSIKPHLHADDNQLRENPKCNLYL